MRCNRELISKMSLYCTKGSRGEKMMLIAAYQVPFDQAKAMVKGLDKYTWNYLMALGSGTTAFRGHKTWEDYKAERRDIRERVYVLMGEGLSFEEIEQRTGVGGQTLGIYATDYAKKMGIDRSEIACVAQNEEKKREKWRQTNQMLRSAPRVNMRTRRYGMNIPLEAIAREMGLSVLTIRRMEEGVRKISPSELATLSQLLDADGAWLSEKTEMDRPKGKNFMGYAAQEAFTASRRAEIKGER